MDRVALASPRLLAMQARALSKGSAHRASSCHTVQLAAPLPVQPTAGLAWSISWKGFFST